MDRCKYCESPFSDERDDEGKPFCECDGATIERLTAYIHELELEIAVLQVQIAMDEFLAATEDDACSKCKQPNGGGGQCPYQQDVYIDKE